MTETLSLFTELHHLCIVVDDLDSAISYYESVGVTPWHDYPPMSDYTDVSLGHEAFETLTYKYCNSAGLQIQLCHPGDGDTPQRAFLETKGPGVYHLGFTVPDVDAAQAEGEARGLGIGYTGRRDDGTGFTYFDTKGSAGVTLEVRSTTSASS